MGRIRQSGQYDDPVVKALKALDAGELRSDEWTRAEGVVLYRGRVYVPDDPQLRHDLLHAHHCAIVAGHPGRWKTLELVLRNYWWPGLSRYVAKFVAGCDTCNRCRRDNDPPSDSSTEPSFRAGMRFYTTQGSCSDFGMQNPETMYTEY